jgi:hypothetical protein
MLGKDKKKPLKEQISSIMVSSAFEKTQVLNSIKKLRRKKNQV